MFRKIMVWLLAAVLVGMYACAFAEDAKIKRGAYIQYLDRAGGTATEIYAADGTLLYPFGELTAWRDIDQRIHAWGEEGEIVLDEEGNLIPNPWREAAVASNDDENTGRYSVEKSDGRDGASDWWRITDGETGQICELRSNGSPTVTATGHVIATTILELVFVDGSTTEFRDWLYRIGEDGLERLDDGQWYSVRPLNRGEDDPVRFIALQIVHETVETDMRDWPLEDGFVPRPQTIRAQKWFLLDEEGKRLNEADLSWITRNQSAADYFDGLVRVETGGLWGYMDINGKMAIPAEYASATDFCNDRAVVFKAGSSPWIGDGAFFLVDTQGNLTPVENLGGTSEIDTASQNLAEYYGCARGYRWDF